MVSSFSIIFLYFLLVSIVDIIQDTLYNNEYKNLSTSHLKTKNNKNIGLQHQATKLVIFTCWGKETMKNHGTFKETQIKVALRNKKMIQHLIQPVCKLTNTKKSGVHQMKCMHCPQKYIG
jgi:hypothetical protein